MAILLSCAFVFGSGGYPQPRGDTLPILRNDCRSTPVGIDIWHSHHKGCFKVHHVAAGLAPHHNLRGPLSVSVLCFCILDFEYRAASSSCSTSSYAASSSVCAFVFRCDKFHGVYVDLLVYRGRSDYLPLRHRAVSFCFRICCQTNCRIPKGRPYRGECFNGVPIRFRQGLQIISSDAVHQGAHERLKRCRYRPKSP